MFQFLIPLILCAFGTYFSFHKFWHGFDAITGDVGDARFNAIILEHTWLWLKGVHSSLFDIPMFYPSTNVYAYSDFMLGSGPIYWFFRFFGLDILLSYQCWMVVSALLNFISFYFLLKKVLKKNVVLSSIGAFVFAFSLPRMTHLEHAQLLGQYFIVLSAIGAMVWWRNPKSKSAPWLFCTGALLQLISAFYFFWFWIWTISIYGFYVVINTSRREKTKQWLNKIEFRSLIAPLMINAVIAFPFLYHYVLAAKEFGRRDWVSVSNTVPRIYSWLNLPTDHWEWSLVPFKDLINQLPMLQEHYLSFGVMTWMMMILSLIWVYRKKPDDRYITIPLITMFAFTITSGRFSTWVLMSYFFPGGGAIRAVGRIQIFMLLFWSILFILSLNELWFSNQKLKKYSAFILVLFLLSESFYISEWNFSRADENNRLDKISNEIPLDCKIIVNPKGFNLHSDFINIDSVMIAFKTGRITANGYSGHEPKNYHDQSMIEKWNSLKEFDGKKVCLIKTN